MENFDYDFCYNNIKPLNELEKDFMKLFHIMIEKNNNWQYKEADCYQEERDYMALYAMGDFHLSFMAGKSMDVFGSVWKNHVKK